MQTESAVQIVRLIDTAKKQALSVRRLEVEVVIDGPLCRSDLRICFANDLDRTVEGDLVFPLPPFAALCELTAKVGRRTLQGKFRPRERAQAEYHRAVQAGKTAMLGESEGEDLGRLRIAPIEVGEDVEVTLGLLHPLTPIADGHRLLLPLTYMPRYVEDEAGLKPTERAAVDRPRPLQLAARANIKVSIRKNGVPIKVRCATHSTQVQDSGAILEVNVRGVPLDRDLHLEICDRNSGDQPTVWVRHDPSPGPDKQGPTTAVALLPPPFADEGATIARAVTLLVDRSGSMSGAPMESAIRAVKGCLRALGPADVFNVVAFSDSLYALSPRPLPFDDQSLQQADAYASGLSANGGTEAASALSAVLDEKLTNKHGQVQFYQKESGQKDGKHRLRIIVMMTDGDVGSAENVLRSAKDRLIDTRLFVIGIGESVNHAMLAQLAELGSGTYTPVSTNEDLERALHKLKNAIDAPLLTGVSVKLEQEGEFSMPKRLEPSGALDLYAGQPLLFAWRGELAKDTVLHLQAQSTDGEDYKVAVPLQSDAQANSVDAESASLLWALLRNRRLTYRFDAADDATLEQLGSTFGLVNRKVALCGVHEEQRDTDAPESVPVVLPLPRNLNQPSSPQQAGPFHGGGPGGVSMSMSAPPPSVAAPAPMRMARASLGAPPPPPAAPAAPSTITGQQGEAELSADDEMQAPLFELSKDKAVAPSRPRPPSAPASRPAPAKKAAPPKAKGGGFFSRVASLFQDDESAEERAVAKADEVDAPEPVSAPPPAPPPPSAPSPIVVPSPAPAAAAAASSAGRREAARAEALQFTDDEAGLRMLLLKQRADGLFGEAGDLAATVVAVAALVSRGHSARTGSFRAELRRTTQTVKALLGKASGDEKILCALVLALLSMPHGEAAPAALPPELAALLEGRGAADLPALAVAVRAVLKKAPLPAKQTPLSEAIRNTFLK